MNGKCKTWLHHLWKMSLDICEAKILDRVQIGEDYIYFMILWTVYMILKWIKIDKKTLLIKCIEARWWVSEWRNFSRTWLRVIHVMWLRPWIIYFNEMVEWDLMSLSHWHDMNTYIEYPRNPFVTINKLKLHLYRENNHLKLRLFLKSISLREFQVHRFTSHGL